MSDLGVRSGGDPTQRHGAFDCSACGRKRLPAVEFSQNMANKARKDPSAQIRCNLHGVRGGGGARARGGDGEACVAEDGNTVATHECAACKALKPADAFSRAQLNNKGPEQRCRECCDAAEAEASASASASVDQRLAARAPPVRKPRRPTRRISSRCSRGRRRSRLSSSRASNRSASAVADEAGAAAVAGDVTRAMLGRGGRR